MTMPHLQNCPHKCGSHCLNCVAEEWNRREAELAAAVVAEREAILVLVEDADTGAPLNQLKAAIRARGGR